MDSTVETIENVVSLTESAAGQVRELLKAEEDPENKGLRLYVEGGGCSGMMYGMVFDEKRADDHVSSPFGVSILVDPFSANYLKGCVVDYVDELNGGGFKISNPNARQSCGCGRSFEA